MLIYLPTGRRGLNNNRKLDSLSESYHNLIFTCSSDGSVHGFQNSVMDIKERRINFFRDVIGVVERLNRNKNGNIFVLCQTGL